MKLRLICALSCALFASPALAEWPEQPIELIVPFSAGGGTDVTARILQPFLERELGQKIVVVNRPGAAGEVGLTALAEAKPDGYTIGILNVPTILTLPISRDTSFDLSSFIPVAGLVRDPSALSVPEDSAFQSLEEFVSYAQDNPGSVTIATTGVGTDDHLVLRLLAKQAGTQFVHVPFAGAGPARTALMGGHVAAAGLNLSEAMPGKEEGAIRILAQFGTETSELAPEIPTAISQGVDVSMYSERGIALPAGVDPEIVEKLAAAIRTVAEDPDYRARNAELFTEVNYKSTADFSTYLDGLNASYHELWAEEPWQ